ncbi:MAG: hypothetical protein HDQ87_10220 [Clostridia bacterium]|nr:hypothetical protein [Clostridia bacterium]
MHRKWSWLALVLAAVMLLAACSSGKDDFFRVGEDQIPTLYTAVGSKKITDTKTGFENGNSYKSVTYESVSAEDMQAYVDALEAIGYAQVQDTEISESGVQTLTMGNNSVTDGKIILIRITLDPNGQTNVLYNVNDGTIEFY